VNPDDLIRVYAANYECPDCCADTEHTQLDQASGGSSSGTTTRAQPSKPCKPHDQLSKGVEMNNTTGPVETSAAP